MASLPDMLAFLTDYGREFLILSATMAPYLILGFLLASVVHHTFPRHWIKQHLGGNRWNESLKATLFGIPLPVCSCGVIPIAKELKKSGASPAGVAAFVASTPQTGIDSIVATAGMMGWPMAWVRVVVAFVSGVLTGGLIGMMDSKITPPAATRTPAPEKDSKVTVPKGKRPSISSILHYGLLELPLEMRASLLVGIALGAAITLLMPQANTLALLQNDWLNYLMVLLIAVPVYVCSTGSIPVAVALLHSGFSAGASLLFLVVGPATNTVTLSALTVIIGKKQTLLYLISLIATALVAALLIDRVGVIGQWAANHVHPAADTLTPWHWLAAALLFAPMIPRKWTSVFHRKTPVSDLPFRTCKLSIKGMSCKKCVAKIEGILGNTDGVRNAKVSLSTATLEFESNLPDPTALLEKLLEPAGFTLERPIQFDISGKSSPDHLP
jgi:uncharacterized membrane protein YraQ (UPF0718 family)/copper chaperone CopZ